MSKKSHKPLTEKQRKLVLKHKKSKYAMTSPQGEGDLVKGKLVCHLGHQVLVKFKDLGTVLCSPQKTIPTLCVGDNVVAQLNPDMRSGWVVDVADRSSVLSRPRPNKRPAILASNIDQIVIVMAVKPEIRWSELDKYLVAAEIQAIKPLIVINKIDMLQDERDKARLDSALSGYCKIGYRTLSVSVQAGTYQARLMEQLTDKTSILIGPSGVGKSSIVNWLLAKNKAAVGQVSDKHAQGKHTTTNASLYSGPQGAQIIDSPGIREFGLWDISGQDLIKGFVDLYPFSLQCKFSNCEHTDEKHCAILKAARYHKVDQRRLDSYLMIKKRIAKLGA